MTVRWNNQRECRSSAVYFDDGRQLRARLFQDNCLVVQYKYRCSILQIGSYQMANNTAPKVEYVLFDMDGQLI